MRVIYVFEQLLIIIIIHLWYQLRVAELPTTYVHLPSPIAGSQEPCKLKTRECSTQRR